MSSQQVRRLPNESPEGKATKYGDVFNVSGELAAEKIAPKDAAAMQSLESSALGTGEIPSGGPAALMQSAAEHNKALGAVSKNEATNAAGLEGVTLTQGTTAGHRVIAEAVAGQVVGGYVDDGVRVRSARAGGQPENQGRRGEGAVGQPESQGLRGEGAGGQPENTYIQFQSAAAVGDSQVTIGEALEAAAKVAGDKPVDISDAAAVEAAEIRATGRGQVMPRGVGARAQAAADLNPKTVEKITLGEAIGTATAKLPADKVATGEDAVRVAAAERRNDPGCEGPRAVSTAVATAARVNEMTKN